MVEENPLQRPLDASLVGPLDHDAQRRRGNLVAVEADERGAWLLGGP